MSSIKTIYNRTARSLSRMIFGPGGKAEWEPNTPAPAAGAEGETPSHSDKTVHIVFCQDASNVQREGRAAIDELAARGYNVELKGVENDRELTTYLDKLQKSGAPAPDAFFLDVGGVGERTALKVIKWFDTYHPEAPLPEINFMSLDDSMGITEAGRLRNSDPRFEANFVEAREIGWTARYLSTGVQATAPASPTFRRVLNKLLNLDIPDKHRDSHLKEELKRMSEVTTDRAIVSWRRKQISTEDLIGKMRNYATGVSTALQQGIYGQDAEALEGLDKSARFYGSAGFPVKGPVALTLQDVENIYYQSYGAATKPVLVMQAYDPAVVPWLSSGKLGGIVVTSPYMASHLKLLCETNMVSGLFGMVPKGKSLSAEFNEEAKPDADAYYAEPPIIDGVKLFRGKEILIGLDGNGLCTKPPEDFKPVALDMRNFDPGSKLGLDVRNIKAVNEAFAQYFAAEGQPAHGIKSNIERADYGTLEAVTNIGLVRTEQMAAASATQIHGLKQALLEKDDYGYNNIFSEARYDYQALAGKLQHGHAVKIRLFDFVHHEIFHGDDQKKFVELYGKTEIHGAEALRTWPKLYEGQVHTIFAALAEEPPAPVKLEIMMPAIRTEEETIEVKKLVDDVAKRMGISTDRYSFGVMAETLDACKNIAGIAKHCDFISFGTNDLTQEFTGMQRGDLKAHASFAKNNGFDPFKTLSPEIFEIMQETIRQGRASNPALKIDVCGAQAADPATAQRLFAAGIDNVSVAPNITNLYALPLLVNYMAFDALKAAAPAVAPQLEQRKRAM